MQIGITNVVPILKLNVHVSHAVRVATSRKSNRITYTYYCASSVFGGVSEEIDSRCGVAKKIWRIIKFELVKQYFIFA